VLSRFVFFFFFIFFISFFEKEKPNRSNTTAQNTTRQPPYTEISTRERFSSRIKSQTLVPKTKRKEDDMKGF